MTQPPPFRLPQAMRDEIVAHARDEAPRECCGMISAREGEPTALHRLRNVHPEPETRYEIDPRQLLDLEFRLLPASGETPYAFYHSHPATAAYPSATDIALASWPGATYVICSLAGGECPILRAFRIERDEIVEVAIAE